MSIWYGNIQLEEVKKEFEVHLIKHLEIEFIELGENYLVTRMPVNNHTRQPMGLLHGGASCVMAETTGSLAALLCLDRTQFQVVGLEINANHVRAVKEGFVYATARPAHLGKRTHVWDIRIVNEQNQLVCISRHTVSILKLT